MDNAKIEIDFTDGFRCTELRKYNFRFFLDEVPFRILPSQGKFVPIHDSTEMPPDGFVQARHNEDIKGSIGQIVGTFTVVARARKKVTLQWKINSEFPGIDNAPVPPKQFSDFYIENDVQTYSVFYNSKNESGTYDIPFNVTVPITREGPCTYLQQQGSYTVEQQYSVSIKIKLLIF